MKTSSSVIQHHNCICMARDTMLKYTVVRRCKTRYLYLAINIINYKFIKASNSQNCSIACTMVLLHVLAANDVIIYTRCTPKSTMQRQCANFSKRVDCLRQEKCQMIGSFAKCIFLSIITTSDLGSLTGKRSSQTKARPAYTRANIRETQRRSISGVDHASVRLVAGFFFFFVCFIEEKQELLTQTTTKIRQRWINTWSTISLKRLFPKASCSTWTTIYLP